MKKKLVVLLFLAMIMCHSYIVSMRQLREVWSRVIGPRGGLVLPQKNTTHMQQSGTSSLWSRIQQSASRWMDQIRSKYFDSPPKSVYVPMLRGQSEITSMPIAAMQQELVQKDLNNILEVIQQNRKVQNLEDDMNGLLRCGYPGPEFLIISEIKSINDFEKFFEDMRKRIFLSSGFDNATTEELLSTIKEKRVSAIKNFYTQARANVIHEDMPQLTTIKKLCMQVGINFDSISIKSIPKLEAWRNPTLGGYIQPTVDARGNINGSELFLNPFVTMGEIRLPGIRITIKLPNIQNFIITHEIGHVIRNHCEEMVLISAEFSKLFPHGSQYASEYLPSIRQLTKQLEALYELEADIIVAMQSPQIAETIGFEIGQAYMQSNQDVRNRIWTPIHSSFAYKKDLFLRILNLHYSKDKEDKLKQLKE